MTQKLEALFDLPVEDTDPQESNTVNTMKETMEKLKQQTMALTLSSKIDSSFSNVSELEKHEREMDLIAEDAIETYGNLIDMAMNVEAQYTARLMEVAAQMMRNAMDARQSKMNAKLRQLELQLKKLQSDRSAGKAENPAEETPVIGQLLDRNELLKKLQTGK
jgi:DNA-binding transcriptional regulator YbjK